MSKVRSLGQRLFGIFHGSRPEVPEGPTAWMSLKSLWKTIILLLLLSTLSFGAAWKVPDAELPFPKKLLEHLSLAFAVSLIVLLAVELEARRLHRKELSEYRDLLAADVWHAISSRSLPVSVIGQIDGLLKATVVKEKCHYTVTIRPRLPGLPADHLIVNRQVVYRLHNISHNRIDYTIRSRIISQLDDFQVRDDTNAPEYTVPRHVEFKVNNKDLLDESLKQDELGRSRALSREIELEPDQRVDVYLNSDDVVPARSEMLIAQTTLVDNVSVTLLNQATDIVEAPVAHFLHPDGERCTPHSDGVYRIDRGFLPGQGFMVSWRTK